MGTPFKMKGSPFQRNYGLESPVKSDDKVINAGTLPTVQVSGGKGGDKKKPLSWFEQSIQDEVNMRMERTIGKTRSEVLAEVREERAKASKLATEKANALQSKRDEAAAAAAAKAAAGEK